MNRPKLRPKVYTVAEVAQLFAISPRLVRDLIHRGELLALRIGRSYRIPRKTADDYLSRALPPTARAPSKLAVHFEDEQTAFLFPVKTIQ